METAETKKEPTYEVLVVVPPREPFKGFWSAQKHWPSGKTKTVVTQAELAELQLDEKKNFLAVEVLKTLAPADERRK